MAESTCLLRSFSHPSDSSREVQQGDPYRALTESISLGRFMSESLAWEKWSTFSHNRYLEEAERISRPGNVAERKAYFEAHYKRKAAERAAALHQVVNGVANEAPASVTRVGECNNSFIERKSEGHTQAVSSEQQNRDSREAVDMAGLRDDGEINLDKSGILERGEESVLQHDLDNDKQVNSNRETKTDIYSREEASFNRDDSEIQPHESSILKMEEESVLQHDCDVGGVREQGNCDFERNANENNKIETKVLQVLRSIGNTDLSLESCSPVNDINQPDDVKRSDNITKLEEIKKTNEAVLDVKIKKAAASSSTKSKISSSIPKPLRSIYEQKVSMTSRASTIAILKTKTPVAHLVDGEGKNNAVLCNVPKRRPVGSQNPTSAKPLRSIDEQKVSMNPRVSTSALPKTKTPVAHLVDDEGENNAVLCNVPKRRPVDSQNPTRVSVSGIMKKPPPAKPLSQCRRSIEQFTKSMIGRGAAEMKLSSSLSLNSSSSATRSNAPPPIIFSPFRFRSEERAEKRKKRLEEKTKSMEAEKAQFQTTSKEKVEYEVKKLCQSSIFSSRLSDDSKSRSESSTIRGKKIPLTRPQSPKLGRKLASSFTHETGIRRSWRPPAAASKSKDGPNHHLSVTSQRERSTRENASPNIQHSALV